jgi:hypothetical protein
MTHQTLVTVSVVIGAVVAMFAGRIYGQMVFERDEQGRPSYAQASAAFLSVTTGLIGAHLLGKYGALLLALLLTVPAFWLVQYLIEFFENAPELQSEPRTSYKSAAEIRRGELNFVRGLGLFCGAIAAAFSCGLIAHFYGVVGAFVAVIIVAPLGVVPALGALPTLFGAILIVCALVLRLFHAVDGLAHRLGLVQSTKTK